MKPTYLILNKNAENFEWVITAIKEYGIDHKFYIIAEDEYAYYISSNIACNKKLLEQGKSIMKFPSIQLEFNFEEE